MKTLFSILLIFLSLFFCKKSDFEIVEATKQNWAGGFRGSGYGTNRTAISLKNCANPEIYSNTITLYDCYGVGLYGIYMDCCSGFHVENNTIVGDGSCTYSGNAEMSTGIEILNSGGDETNQIYRNIITDCMYGITACEKNRGLGDFDQPAQGLKFFCNEFSSFDDAFYLYVLVGSTNLNNPVYGVSVWQQGAISGISNFGSPNYNIIHSRTLASASENDFYNEHNNTTSGNWDIEYKIPYGNPPNYNINYKSSTINSSANSSYTLSNPHCESRLPTFTYADIHECSNISDVYPQYTAKKSQLGSLVNSGDHDYLYNLVENVTTSDLSTVYNALMTSTPSHDILTLACGNELFTANMIENILVENSYGIKSKAVRDAIENREDNLSDQQMENIYEASESISTYEDLMYQIDHMNQEYIFMMNESLNALTRRDTTPIPMDSVKMYLEAIGDFLSKIKLIDISFKEDDIENAQELFNELETVANEEDEYQDYSDLFDILLDIYSLHNGDFTQLTTNQLSVLNNMTDYHTYAAGITKQILSEFDEDFVWETIHCAACESQGRKANPKISSSEIKISIYPNPAKDELSVLIPNCDDCIGKFIIFDINGKEIYSENLTQNLNSVSLSKLNSGIYIVKIITQKEIIIKKIIVNK